MKYVLVSGGVISGIGKGLIDPYLNIDAGTMRPQEHGEVFVLDDGGEVDLDLGNYERYLNITLKRDNNITTGKMYAHVIEKERKGDYLGKTVQIVPHLTDAVVEWIERVAKVPVDDTNEEPDVCVVELGGTVGDIESAPFIEALRRLRRRAGKNNFLQAHVSLIPSINGELKTKPTQAAIRDVRSLGLHPDLIACRCSKPLDESTIQKVALYCDVDRSQVVSVTDVESLYHVPILLESQSLIPILKDLLALDKLHISPALVSKGSESWSSWKTLTYSRDRLYKSVSIALVGKYVEHPDAYHSVVKSLEHAAMTCSRKLELITIDAEHLEEVTRHSDPAAFHKAWHQLYTANGVLVPGGFGERGTDGMISAIRSARENFTPFLGICLGMQMAVLEYSRNVLGMTAASSEEFAGRTDDSVIIFMPQINRGAMGGNMRLGLKETHFQPGSEWSKIRALYENEGWTPAVSDMSDGIQALSLNSALPTPPSPSIVNGTISPPPTPNAPKANGTPAPRLNGTSNNTAPFIINERHRHRYEVNPAFIEKITTPLTFNLVPPVSSTAGPGTTTPPQPQHELHFVGKDDTGQRMEILELKNHPWFVGVQFHPEYLSRVLKPSKPYLGFVAAASGVLGDVIGYRHWDDEMR